MSTQDVIVVRFTDGKDIQPIVFKPGIDDDESIARVVDAMKRDGWLAIKGSEQQLSIVDGRYEPRRPREPRVLPAGFPSRSAFIRA